MQETWKPTAQRADYQISNWGNLRNSAGYVLNAYYRGNQIKYRGFRFRIDVGANTYPKWFKASLLVMTAFVGPVPPGYEIDHVDDNPHNDRLDNLQYVTKSQNIRKSYLTGKRKWPRFRRLSDAERAQILVLAADGVSHNKIAGIIDCSPATISRYLKKQVTL